MSASPPADYRQALAATRREEHGLVLMRSAAERADVTGFWDLANRQDWQLCERVQKAAGSCGLLPRPYQTSEDCVPTFDRWYANRMAAAT
jgi:hypothetical protein